MKWYRKSADQGFAGAQYNLGAMYANGEGVPQNATEAVKWYRRAADQGLANAQFGLGHMYADGVGVRQDAAEAVKWYRKAADQGLADAQYFLGTMYDNGEGVQQDAIEAVKWYSKAADQGDALAQYVLGEIYAEGKSVRQDVAEAVKWYRKAADQGFAGAQHNLGIMYVNGKGIRQDPAEAVKWFRKAADQGLASAQFNLGVSYYEGIGVRQNAAEAVKWFRKAAEHGDAHAQFNLGLIYNEGKSVRQDTAEAVKWFRKAADQGDARAQSKLGFIYNDRQDAAEAVKWFRKAADQGNARAQFNLGLIYIEGKGVRQDTAEAVKWFRKAADQGHANSQFKLGTIYNFGEGVRQDPNEAVKWYQLTLTNPDSEDVIKQLAQAALNELPTAAPQVQSSVVSDHKPPNLSIDNSNTQTITQGDLVIQGLATDPSGVAEVTVDGKQIELAANGAFSLKRFFPLGETVLEIVATDIHGNHATQKLTVIRQAAATQIAADEPALTPPPAKTRPNPNALALIVGVENYRNAPQARWAAQDAAMFYDYAQRSLGIPAGNIKLLTGEQANRTGLLAALKNWLAPMITPGKSQVYVYFAGHGLAASEGDKAYLIPQDGDPSLLEDTALDRQRLFDEIAKVKPMSTTVFLDTCYSGGARGGDGTLVANARPVLIKSKAATLPPGFMQFSAASGDQLAHSHPSQQHGLFSYYLMRGLSGEADTNHDSKLTAGELQDFVQAKVKRMALTQGRPQEPELIGDRERVIANWGR